MGVEMKIVDELEALVRGIDFMLQSDPGQCYFLDHFKFGEDIVRTTHKITLGCVWGCVRLCVGLCGAVCVAARVLLHLCH